MANAIRKLAIIGASARAAAFSAIRAGYDVVTADLFADADLRRACPATRIKDYPHGFADWLAETDCDAWLYTGALENHPQLIDRLATIRPLLGNSGEPLRQARDPLLLQKICCEAAVSFPETRASAVGLPRDGSWLAKTYRGASGIGVSAFDIESSATHSAGHPALLQRFIEGLPASAVYAVNERDVQLLGVTRQVIGDKRLGASTWQYAGSVGPPSISAAIKTQLVRLGRLLHHLRLRGLVGADLMLADNRAWLIEINPRYTSSVEVVERFGSVHPITAHVEACTSSSAFGRSPDYTGSFLHGKAILFAKRDVTISPALHNWAMRHTALDPAQRVSLADIPATGERIGVGHPVLSALVSAPATDYEQQMNELISSIESTLYNP